MALPIHDGFGSVGPVGQSTTLTTNSTTTLDPVSRLVYVATDGTLQVTLVGDTVSNTWTVYAGTVLPIRAKQVHACPAGTIAAW